MDLPVGFLNLNLLRLRQNCIAVDGKRLHSRRTFDNDRLPSVVHEQNAPHAMEIDLAVQFYARDASLTHW